MISLKEMFKFIGWLQLNEYLPNSDKKLEELYTYYEELKLNDK